MLKRLFEFLSVFATVGLLASLAACAGYSLRKNTNPLEGDGINSVSIPMFINHSNFAGASSIFTKAFFDLFQEFPGLEVYSGESSRADALLLGIIQTPKRNNEVFDRGSTRFTDTNLSPSLGDRPHFLVPDSTIYRVNVRLVLIKNPTLGELELLRSPQIGPQLTQGPKIIFNRTLEHSATFQHRIEETSREDSPGIVNFTNTRYFFQKSLEGSAQDMAHNFKELVLNAF